MIFLLAAVFVFPVFSFAGFDGPEHTHEPHEPHSPALCSQGAVQACVAEHWAGAAAAEAQALSYLPVLADLSAKLAAARAERDAKKAQVDLAQSELDLLSAEIGFSKASSPPGAAEIFPGFPSPESFFSLRPLDKLWLGRYPADRVGYLEGRFNKATEEKAELDDSLDKFTKNFTKVSSDFTSAKKERDDLLAVANQHGAMCRGGCHDLLCPPREP
jgi:hypothetical protein